MSVLVGTINGTGVIQSYDSRVVTQSGIILNTTNISELTAYTAGWEWLVVGAAGTITDIGYISIGCKVVAKNNFNSTYKAPDWIIQYQNGEITPEIFNDLKTLVKTIMNKRKYNGSLTQYGTSAYDYTSAPAQGTEVAKEHYTKIRIPLNALNPTEMPPDISGVDRKVLASDIQFFRNRAKANNSVPAQAQNVSSTKNYYVAATDCGSACTGTCISSCSLTCTIGCTVSCADDCTSGCAGGCKSTCTGSCAGSCSGGCYGGCYSACALACSDGCTGSCGSTCNKGCQLSCSTDGCTGNCGSTCAKGCSDGCTGNCGRACEGECEGGCSDNCAIGCLSSDCSAACASSCTGSNCSSTCINTCKGTCSDTCTGGCAGACSSCAGGCENVCGYSCDFGCISSCANDCSVTCGSLSR